MGGSTTNTGGAAGAGGGDGGGGAAQYAPGEVIWEASFGDGSDDVAVGISIAAGALTVGGHFDGSLSFGGSALVSGGGSDLFLARFGAAGEHAWSENYGGAGVQHARAMSLNPSGQIAVVGQFNSPSMNIGLGTMNAVGSEELFVAEFNASGQPILGVPFGGTGDDDVALAAWAASGDLVVAGEFTQAIELPGHTLSLVAQSQSDVFIAGLNDVDANHLWSRSVTSGYTDITIPKALAVDGGGNLSIVAHVLDAAANGASLSYDGSFVDGWSGQTSVHALFRTDSSGVLDWHKIYGPGAAIASDTSTFTNGDILVCGYYASNGTVGGGISLPTPDGYDVWVARYASTGALLWARQLGGAGNDGQIGTVKCVAQSDGTHVIAASSDGDFAVGTLTVPGVESSVVVAHINDDGSPIWTRRTNGAGDLIDLAADDSVAALVMNFDTATGMDTTHDSAGGTDIFLAVLAL